MAQCNSTLGGEGQSESFLSSELAPQLLFCFRFCSQVWQRGNIQLRVWEMQDMDDEARVFVCNILNSRLEEDPPQRPDGLDAPPLPLESYHRKERRKSRAEYHCQDLAYIAPFTVSKEELETQPSSENTMASSMQGPQPATPQFLRPPMFGPERVVLDPRIKAVHQQVMRDILWVGFWYTFVSSLTAWSIIWNRKG